MRNKQINKNCIFPEKQYNHGNTANSAQKIGFVI